MRSLRAVTFEVTSTLVCMSVPLGQVYGDALRHFKLPGVPDDGEMKAAFKRAYATTGKELPNFGAAEGMPERVWWDKMIRSTLCEAGCEAALDDDTFPLVFQRIYSSFGSADVWAECPDGVAAMRHAKDAGLVVGAMSNVYPRYIDQNLPLLGLHRDLDFAATSHEFGVKKPSPGLFDAARRRATHASRLLYGRELPDIEPAQMLHVGDDLQNDYLAARSCGMHALLYDPKGKAEPSEELPYGAIVTSLAEVPAKIDALLGADGA